MKTGAPSPAPTFHGERPASTVPDMDRPMQCQCDDSRLGSPPRNKVSSYEIQFVDGIPEKAKIWPGTGRVQIDKRFWQSLSAPQQTAVLAHELAHDEDPDGCESCADARAGARMRYEGISAPLAVNALGSVVRHRSSSAAVLYGWKVADAAIASQGSTRGQGAAQLANSEETIAPVPGGRKGYAGPVAGQHAPRGREAAAHVAAGLDEGEDFGLQTSIGLPAADVSGVEDSGAGQSFDTTPGQTTSTNNFRPVVSERPRVGASTPLPPSSTPSKFPSGTGPVLVIAAAVVLVVVVVRIVRKK